MNFFRDVCKFYFENYVGMIGREGQTVQIDECILLKEKIIKGD
jgi:hypothetical protein